MADDFWQLIRQKAYSSWTSWLVLSEKFRISCAQSFDVTIPIKSQLRFFRSPRDSLWNLERPSASRISLSAVSCGERRCIPVAGVFPFRPIGIRRRATRISGVRDRFGRRRGGSLALKVYSSNLYPSWFSLSLSFSLTPSESEEASPKSLTLQLRDNGLVESPCCSLTDLAADRDSIHRPFPTRVISANCKHYRKSARVRESRKNLGERERDGRRRERK